MRLACRFHLSFESDCDPKAHEQPGCSSPGEVIRAEAPRYSSSGCQKTCGDTSVPLLPVWGT
jgi:hypothetical protein